jgi:hypothetical protein
MTRRTCILCRHLSWIDSEPGYSEYTPGSSAGMNCGLNVWYGGSFDHMSESEYRKYLLTADSCGKFEEADLPPQAIPQLPT